ncbi:DUF4114 domain-containing protein [Roseofilum casamattae]|uniref:DUF4114 domain-containing protein n=1 Tax=Roseofilum casamattae BLCC-M143 TaxID=3022442 RepID=A0ABT7BYS7_9CYAN|nr:DUF4114 domain-containing protein [Roseofilum casamattae]MDJ1184364.1 DUF4114 domain-containing protein [Roseofilum casamattae BLCC-M143]
MKFNVKTSFAIAAATLTSVLSVSAAQAFPTFNLRAERPDLFNEFNSRVNQERLKIEDESAGMLELDPETLRWTGGADSVDVAFINEGAGYRNKLFFSANSNPSQMIFNDIASPESILPESNGPLSLGDGVKLGTFAGETSLDFTIQNPHGHMFGAKSNPDGLQHLIAYEYFDEEYEENWVLLGFEDLWGVHYSEGGHSDRDFNDVVIAVRGMTGDAMVQVPEPTSTAAIFGLAALGMTGLRRGKKSS